MDRKSATPQPVRKRPDADLNQFLNPNLGGRVRRLSKSSEDILGRSERFAGELRDGLSASLQKDLNLVGFLNSFGLGLFKISSFLAGYTAFHFSNGEKLHWTRMVF